MGTLNIFLFISFSLPLLLTLIVCKGKTRTLLTFLLLGMVVCLFCGELSGFVLNKFPVDSKYFTVNFTPLFEELLKGLPIIVYAFTCNPKRRTLLECSILVGVGFAVLENACFLADPSINVSFFVAIFRGLGAGILHSVCTLMVGYGMSFVYIRRKLFYTGTFALMSVAVILHSIYNTLVQSEHQIFALVLPLVIFIPIMFLMEKTFKTKN